MPSSPSPVFNKARYLFNQSALGAAFRAFATMRLIEKNLQTETHIDHPTFEQVRATLERLTPRNEVSLLNLKGDRLVALGARARFGIYRIGAHDSERWFAVGRKAGGILRGSRTIRGNQILQTQLENWAASDGVEVFRYFLENTPLESRFTLRDISTEYPAEHLFSLTLETG